MNSRKLNVVEISKKWKADWDKSGIYQTDLIKSTKPFYNLMMFPYPSAEGLHVGNMYAFTGTDIYGRYQRMNGFDVFEPIGLDGFGIHSENYAIKVGKHPKDHARTSEENFYRQLSEIGNGFAWDNRLETYDPDYYRWTQWVFVQMYKKGLAYRGEATVNWCPSCKTVLADEQVINEHCERCDSEVGRKKMSSWYFKITEYADRLLQNIDKINWPEKIKTAQRTWIGRKEGININYPIEGSGSIITCFTTRPDTNFGATFVVVAPEYAQSKLLDLMPQENKRDVMKYIKTSLNKSEQHRQEEGRDKTGAFTGLYTVNQLNNSKMPVWVSDFVLMGFGTGAVVGVPGHDKRDFEFATKFDLPVVRVVVGSDGDTSDIKDIKQVQEEEGKMINSKFLNGMNIHEATQKIMDHLEEKGWGERQVSYHLRDWLISRQRYWGAPIPMVNCEKCGWNPVPEDELPVLLPEIKDYRPKGDGSSPLSNAPREWKYVRCPMCGGEAERELDVCDTFLDSSWYFMAYPNLNTEEYKDGTEKPFNDHITKKWLPVDTYVGGAEHAVLHLLYSRFVTMVLNDLGYITFEEPFPFLYSHGLLIKDGAKISKSRGNIIVPDDYIKKYGADAFRTYLMFLGPFDQAGDFRDSGVEGMHRFVRKIWDFAHFNATGSGNLSEEIERKMHQTIKKVTKDIETFRYNTAISSVMEYINLLKENQNALTSELHKKNVATIVKLMAPFMPFVTEEIWHEVLGEKESIHISKWPEYDEGKVKEENFEIAVQVNGKLRGQIMVSAVEIENQDIVVSKAREDQKVSEYLKQGSVVKEIYIKGRIVNFVVR